MLDFEAGVAKNRATGDFAFTSVCSAHPDVIAACLRLAKERDVPVIIEATSNQVNQFGGYTGMNPADFIAFALGIAKDTGVDPERIIFGGDHLGPQAWRSEPPQVAMEKAREMIAAYVAAGFTKIHLDCSEGCAGEPAQVGDDLCAARAADLAQVAEGASTAPHTLSYIVGTEVPPPGGARHDDETVLPTDPADAARTISITKQAFAAAGLAHVWPRVRALVVQPGLEFAPAHVHKFDETQPDFLTPVLADEAQMSFEAHSTDYQVPSVFRDLARRHFSVMKVGPALTFAYRQAIYALAAVQAWREDGPGVPAVMAALMADDPGYWAGHYHGDEPMQKLMCHFGYADRIRYYWAKPEAQKAVAELEAKIDTDPPADPALMQYFSHDVIERAAVLQDRGLATAKSFVHAQIELALAPYLDVIS
ncbi:tagatose-6-phosphate kinase [Loktanella sp. D2R18]|uniref:class II D-tagatose-bisphosphate aldolase non-catalytic subunit n=1 Tax=Rhodobacterales TaxID=204455 RepID=UPI000DEA9EE1|nr:MULTISPECIES: class II D-tagatose-bisphosphate aldolase, non-catalytic subunit [Rhodobacterales]MDO6591903.1 class II D-tagatose-bisphosphate aldolase, non-catalytic subunit [Yoonia sp. 1_MG-2023]RBW42666.1 tagatose-6-phosphate kinase [Loktanella sp. D2R18]